MTSFSNLAMYALTVQPPSTTQQAIVGDFAGIGRQQLLTVSGSTLTLVDIHRAWEDPWREILSHNMFCIIRTIAAFRLAGSAKDLIAVTSDSGRIITLEYMKDEGEFKSVHDQAFGKSGIRRVIPGQYLAADPKGRAIMIASVEKNKLVYIFNRSTSGEILISSPLEAHKPQTLVYSLCALDVGYANPIFAALELEYTESDADPSGVAYQEVKKELVYYELDLGLNHVVRKWAEPVDRTANLLFRVPSAHGGKPAPSGVLVCSEDNISYHRMHMSPSDILRVPIPRRQGATEDPNRKRCIVSGTQFAVKNREFFYLLQTEDGDIFKLVFDLGPGPSKDQCSARRLKIKYFDTVPVATNICLLRTGYVYCASETGDRILYDLDSIAEEDDEPVFDSDCVPSNSLEPYSPVYFRPRQLRFLRPQKLIASLNPLTDMQIANPRMEDAPQIYTISGTGARSTFRTSRHALNVVDLIESMLPDVAKALWVVKKTVYDEVDTYIVLSLRKKTLVLLIGEEVEEAQDVGFITETETLGAYQMGEDCMVQIYPKGIRVIQSTGEVNDWHTPEHRSIVSCAANNRQVTIALSSGEIYYFQVDEDGRSLAKADNEASLETTITCLAIGDVPEGRTGTRYLAVGCDDSTVRIFSLFNGEHTHILKQQSLQALSAYPSALSISTMKDRSPQGYGHYLHVGLSSGVYIRTAMDDFTGELSETRRRFLGTNPIKFAKIRIGIEPAVIILSSRSWLAYSDPANNTLALTPLHYEPLESAFNFESDTINGIIGVCQQDLRIFVINELSSKVHQDSIPLQYTPTKFACDMERGLFYVIERESDTMDPNTRKMLEAGITDQDGDINMEKSKDGEPANGDVNKSSDRNQMEERDRTNGETPNGDIITQEPGREEATGVSNGLDPEQFGYPRARGHWSSCIQVVDPVHEKRVLQTIELGGNRCAVSVALVPFESKNNETFLVVGAATNMSFVPHYYSEAWVLIYRLLDGGSRLEFFSQTEVNIPPLAMLPFKGKLLIGLGRDLGLYDLGKINVLRKALAKNATPSRIVGLKTQGSRIIAADQRESVVYIVHKEGVRPNRLIPFADDSVSRHVTAVEMVDYETVAGADKFGNIWMVRCPPKVSEVADEGEDGGHLLQEKSYLGGTPNRHDLVMNYFTNDVPVAMHKASLVAGGEKVLVWAGLQGTIGVLIPFHSRREFKMFQELQSKMREEDKSLLGRDHIAFRSYYAPIKNVLDGDLIERFLVLSRNKREKIASMLEGGWDVEAVEKKIWDMRGLYAF